MLGIQSGSDNFNPRSHERSDQSKLMPMADIILFQSTLPREERLNVFSLINDIRNFNPRSHERSDILILALLILFVYFNPSSQERSDSLNQ